MVGANQMKLTADMTPAPDNPTATGSSERTTR